jgi:hypothetical protein
MSFYADWTRGRVVAAKKTRSMESSPDNAAPRRGIKTRAPQVLFFHGRGLENPPSAGVPRPRSAEHRETQDGTDYRRLATGRMPFRGSRSTTHCEKGEKSGEKEEDKFHHVFSLQERLRFWRTLFFYTTHIWACCAYLLGGLIARYIYLLYC